MKDEFSEEIDSFLKLPKYETQIEDLHDDSFDNSIFPNDLTLEQYTFIKSLGIGSSSKVRLAFNKNTQEKVAIKIVPRNKVQPALEKERKEKREIRIYRETIISALLNHPHIVRLIDFQFDDSFFYLIFEYVQGVQLFDIILKNGRVDEVEARRIFRQILSAVDYLHNNCIVHRDLKIENIIIDINGNVKLIDFGLSNFFDDSRFLTTFCGSLYFAAPELLIGRKYKGPEVDIWSLGVILYTMLCGCVPFDDKDVSVLQRKIKEGKFEFPNHLSNSAMNLLNAIMVVSSEERASISEIINSTWANESFNSTVDNYMQEKSSILTVDLEVCDVLESAMFFQFQNLKKTIFEEVERNKMISVDNIRPFIGNKYPELAVYNLLLESKNENKNSKIYTIKKNNPPPAIIKEFIEYLFKKTNIQNNIGLQNIQMVEKTTDSSFTNHQITFGQTEPIIRNSIVQGIFRGIRIEKDRRREEVFIILKDFCKKNNIMLEPHRKNYLCLLRDQCILCSFKISIFRNLITNKYVYSFKHLFGDERAFEKCKRKFQESIN